MRADARASPSGYLFIAGAALCWGFTAAFAKFLLIRRVDPLTLAQVRASFSFLLLLLFVLAARRAVLKVAPLDAAGLALLGVCGLAFSNYSYLSAIQLTNVTTAILIQYTAPVWVLLFSAAFLRERLTTRHAVAAGLSFGGCTLAVGAYQASQLEWNPLGIVWGLGAAMTFSFTNLWGRRMALRVALLPSLLYALGATSVFWALVRSPARLLAAGYPGTQWALFLAYAVLSVLIPYTLYYTGLKRLSPTHAVVTATLEPVFAILFAFLLVGEQIATAQLTGMAAVVGAVVLLGGRRP